MNQPNHTFIPLDVGQRVQMQLSQERIWTIVRGWKPPSVILVDMPEKGEALESKVGRVCEIQYLREGIFHRFETEILGVLGAPPLPQFWVLRYPRGIKGQNLRSFPRIRTQCPASVVDPKGGTHSCELRDISLGGCRVRIPGGKIACGDRLVLSCVLPNQRSLVDVPCEVKRVYAAHVYGLEFRELDVTSRKSLENFLMIFSKIQSMESGIMAKGGMMGDLEEISLPDLLQVLVNSRKSYQVDITRQADRGRVYVRNGEIPYATTLRHSAIDAIFELFSWSRGRYHIQKAEWIPERNLNVPLEYLLLEFARRLDHDAMEEDQIPARDDRGAENE